MGQAGAGGTEDGSWEKQGSIPSSQGRPGLAGSPGIIYGLGRRAVSFSLLFLIKAFRQRA